MRALLGPLASEALDRGEVVPARRVVAQSSQPLASAVSLLLIGDAVASAEVARTFGEALPALHPWLIGEDELRCSIELAPHGFDAEDWLVAADWPPRRASGEVPTDHVLGVGGASTMLAQCTVRPTVQRSLDVGTGCGVQALHLSRHSRSVVATDISQRALRLAAFNAALNDIELELRHGSLFEPVAGERFDLVVANPPFVIGAPVSSQREYRDAGRPGDEVCATLVRSAHEHLTEGGWCQLLANWEIGSDGEWSRGPAQWLDGSPLDAWVLQREVQDPAAYVETWLRDAQQHLTPGYEAAYDAWLGGLQARGVVGVGFGLVTLRAGGSADPVRRFQHHDGPLAQPIAPAVEGWFARQDLLAARPGAEVLTLVLHLAADVRVDSSRRPGHGPTERVVVQESGLRFTGTLDGFGERLLDRVASQPPGSAVAVGEIVAGLALDEGLAPADVLGAGVAVRRRLVEGGFLLAGGPSGAPPTGPPPV